MESKENSSSSAISILKLSNPKQKPILNKIKNRVLMLSPTVRAGLERECVIDDFEKDNKEVGKGGYGSVWKVIHKATRKVWCIKVISKEDIIQQKLVDQMNREIEIMYKINHPHCLKLKNHFEDDNNFYLIMPLCVKGQLYKLLRQSRTFSERNTAQVLRETISGLQYLHSMNPPIIHRDIKPENLLLNENFRIFLADYGWSNYMLEGTNRKTFCGTPEYIAPEMLRKEPHDHRVDIWSVGILMFEMLAGYSPFCARSNIDLFQNIKKLKIQWPSDMPPLAKNLISKILKLNPNERLSLEEILNHKWFKQTTQIKPLLKNDLKTTKDILMFHMVNKITPEIESQIDELLNINDKSTSTNIPKPIKNENSNNSSINNNDSNSNKSKASKQYSNNVLSNPLIINDSIKHISSFPKKNSGKSLSGSSSINKDNKAQVTINIHQEKIDQLYFENSKLNKELEYLKAKFSVIENENKKYKIDNDYNNKVNEAIRNSASAFELLNEIKRLKEENDTLRTKDKERLNLLIDIEEKNNEKKELLKKLDLLQKDKEELLKNNETLLEQINDLKNLKENYQKEVKQLNEKINNILLEKNEIINENLKKIELLQLKLLNRDDVSSEKNFCQLLEFVLDSFEEIKILFNKKIDSFCENFTYFQKEYSNREMKFNELLNNKSIEIISQIDDYNKAFINNINKIMTNIHSPNANVQNDKIEWLNKQIQELNVYKTKGYEYETKINGLTNILNVLRENYNIAQNEIESLKNTVKYLNKEKENYIKSQNQDINRKDSKDNLNDIKNNKDNKDNKDNNKDEN